MAIFFYKELTRNSEIKIPPSEFCTISGDWGELRVPDVAGMCLIECYWMLQIAKVTAFTISELLRENQQRGKTTFCTGLISGKNLRILICVFDWLLLHSLYYLLFLYPSHPPSLCTVFDVISSNINVFNVHQKDWLTYSGEADRAG